jgi:hypothetical protein
MKQKKYLLYLLFIVTITVVLIELFPYVVSPKLVNESFSKKVFKSELNNQLLVSQELVFKEEGGSKNEYLGSHILHPYLGFVSVPRENYNRFGLPGGETVIQKSNDTLNVCLMGGSVAKELYQRNKQDLIKSLETIPAFASKKIRVVALAMSGYKQPQQLMALNYFLSLGAQYDIVINLDGFNEIVLPYADNLPFKVFPSYPRHWHMYSRKKLDSRVQLLLAKQLSLNKEKEELNSFYAKSIWGKSNFGLLLWKIKYNKLTSEIFEQENNLRALMTQAELDSQANGPWEDVLDTVSFFNNQADLWQRSSNLIYGLSKVSNFNYFHFLQPNQYVESSKLLTEGEYRVAYQDSFSYKTGVEIGYPLLISRGKKLKDTGIYFTDLTPLFKEESRSVYRDKCCHFNELGYKSIAGAIANKVKEYYNAKK